MDGTLDLVTSSGVQADRFTTSGPISSLDMDASGHVWSVSEGGGLRVNVEGTWLAGDREVGALPSDDLTAVEASGPEPWVGSAGRGLAHLVPPPVVVPTDPAQPTPTQAVVMRLDERIFVPRVLRQRSPVPVRLPRQ
jgi:hypothetical protein